MSAVHEYVHERTKEERQPDQDAQNVSAVLAEQQPAANEEKAEQHEPCSRIQETSLLWILMFRVVMHGHGVFLLNDQPAAKHAHRACKFELSGFLWKQLHRHRLACGQLRAFLEIGEDDFV